MSLDLLQDLPEIKSGVWHKKWAQACCAKATISLCLPTIVAEMGKEWDCKKSKFSCCEMLGTLVSLARAVFRGLCVCEISVASPQRNIAVSRQSCDGLQNVETLLE